METKQKIRSICKGKRNSLTENQINSFGEKICNNVISFLEKYPYKNVLCYASIQNEPDLMRVMEYCKQNGVRFFLPKVKKEDINFFQARDFSTLTLGSYGIMEPLEVEEFSRQEDAVILVPGIAFDRHGNRIGFGKGYYDRFLKKHPHLYKIGIAYDFQLDYEWIPDVCDIKMNLIITDKKEVLCDGIKGNM